MSDADRLAACFRASAFMIEYNEVYTMKQKKILPPTYLFTAIVMMVVLHFLLPLAKFLSFPWNLTGLIPFAAGIYLNLAADSALKKKGTTVKPFETSTSLIADGPYRVSRHPMYLGFVLLLAGIALFMGSLAPFAVVVVFPFMMEGIFIRTEERMMEETFGDGWREYKNRVRRWI